jgi:DNA topoisomerase I
MKEYIDQQSEIRKSRSKEEKDADAEIRKATDWPYTHALVDGLREKIGNFRVEPPALFRGRGEHPKMGQLKKRIYPEDIMLNMGRDAPAPMLGPDMAGHAYKDIIHDNTVTWLAYYLDSVNGAYKYVFLNAASGFKGQSDWLKYERARQLKNHIDDVRREYTRLIESSDHSERQVGTAAYLIDHLALRVGNEKNTDEEADTVGCCSLRVEHIEFDKETQSITLDFLGKDSIRFYNTVHIESARVFANLLAFAKKKKPTDMIFDISPDSVNVFFKQFMAELSAKVKRMKFFHVLGVSYL